MKRTIVPFVVGVLALAGCRAPIDDASKQEREQEQQQQVGDAARKAGHTAYNVAQDAKEAAILLAHDLKAAGMQAKQGWEDARRQHQDTSCQR
jgi:hypothetical protein